MKTKGKERIRQEQREGREEERVVGIRRQEWEVTKMWRALRDERIEKIKVREEMEG